ncbi:hypothetical protein GCM10010176_105580 [Nonomuraea spiralis]|nr:hypothetical protein GCM10010176_105580 [Nonomuraea spiralis]
MHRAGGAGVRAGELAPKPSAAVGDALADKMKERELARHLEIAGTAVAAAAEGAMKR